MAGLEPGCHHGRDQRDEHAEVVIWASDRPDV